MGQFSWITQDTNESIINDFNDGYVETAVMHDNKGNKWIEDNYEGYGVFGGKDFYQLLAEMNNLKVNGDVDHDRNLGISFASKRANNKFISPNLTRSKNWQWIDQEPEDCEDQGWSVKAAVVAQRGLSFLK